MNDKAALLAQLRDIHLPPPVSFFPLAIGWYVLIAMMIFAIGLTLYFYRRSYIRRKAKQRCLNYLTTLQESPPPSNELAGQVSMLLKRWLLVFLPRKQIANLHGEAWLAQLMRLNPKVKANEHIKRALISAPYQKSCDINSEELIAWAKSYIKTCQVKKLC